MRILAIRLWSEFRRTAVSDHCWMAKLRRLCLNQRTRNL